MNVKLLIQKLTLPRLRKMQALVRGFLTRRLIYPPLKEEYILACSILELISMNVVYRVGSELMVSSMALFKYERENIDAE